MACAISRIFGGPSGAGNTSRARDHANTSATIEIPRMTHNAAFSELPNTASIVPPSWASQPTIEPPIGINAPRGRSPQGQDGSRTGEGYRTSWYVTCGRRSADGSGATTMQGMRTVLGVALAGAVGALARWGLGARFGHRFPSFPGGAMVLTVTGALILGVMSAGRVGRELASGSP